MVTHVSGGDARRARFVDVRWVAETGSTNADAMELARQGEPEGVVVVADHQTAGRGRRDRRWEAPPGSSLLLSILLRPPVPLAPLAPVAVGLAAAEAAAAVLLPGPSHDVQLKWPNDVVVSGRKLAGILAEADWPAGSNISDGWRAPSATERATMVVGLGLNVKEPDGGGLSVEGAVALDELAGAPVDRSRLLDSFLDRLDGWYQRLLDDGPAPLLDAWRSRSATLGQRVRVDLGAEDVEGTAVDITDQGHLVVDTVEGQRRMLAVGDVVHLRARGSRR